MANDMTTYHAQHDALFRTVADILARDYIAPSETADTVAEKYRLLQSTLYFSATHVNYFINNSEIAISALIADVEGYEKR